MRNDYIMSYSASKKRSNHKIKPYHKSWKKNITKSQKRPPRPSKFSHTDKFKMTQKSSLLPSQKISENSSLNGSNLGTYDKDLYQHETLSSRDAPAETSTSFITPQLHQPSISPKRSKVFYK